MAKIIVTTQSNGQQIIHDSDGKNSALPTSAGKTIVVSSNSSGKTTAVHGQIAPTNVLTTAVFDNPA